MSACLIDLMGLMKHTYMYNRNRENVLAKGLAGCLAASIVPMQNSTSIKERPQYHKPN